MKKSTNTLAALVTLSVQYAWQMFEMQIESQIVFFLLNLCKKQMMKIVLPGGTTVVH